MTFAMQTGQPQPIKSIYIMKTLIRVLVTLGMWTIVVLGSIKIFGLPMMGADSYVSAGAAIMVLSLLATVFTLFVWTDHKHTVKLLPLLLLFAFASCQSKSGQLSRPQPEKVVIISLRNSENGIKSYKVNRLEKGVVCYVYSPDYYLPGDTILTTFKY